MSTTVKNIIAIVAGILIGGLVNSLLVGLNGPVVPLPEGADNSSMEALKNSIHLFETKHFLVVFMGHAIGTLVGALIAALISPNQKMKFALIIGCFFLLGGIAANYMFRGPTWFTVLDILVAYVPMGWLGGKIALSRAK